jgi:hypothetical protein
VLALLRLTSCQAKELERVAPVHLLFERLRCSNPFQDAVIEGDIGLKGERVIVKVTYV